MIDKKSKISLKIAEIMILLTFIFTIGNYHSGGRFVPSFPYMPQIVLNEFMSISELFNIFIFSVVMIMPIIDIFVGFVIFKNNKKWLLFLIMIISLDEIYMCIDTIRNKQNFSLFSLVGILALISLIAAMINSKQENNNEKNEVYRYDNEYAKNLFKSKCITIVSFGLLAFFALVFSFLIIIYSFKISTGEFYEYLLDLLCICFFSTIYILVFLRRHNIKIYKESIPFLLGPLYEYYSFNGLIYQHNVLTKKEKTFAIKSVSYCDEAYYCTYINDKGKKSRLVIPNYYPGIEVLFDKKTKINFSESQHNKLYKKYSLARLMLIVLSLFRFEMVRRGYIDLNDFYGNEKVIFVVLYVMLPILMYLICYILSKKNNIWLKIGLILFFNNSAFMTTLVFDYILNGYYRYELLQFFIGLSLLVIGYSASIFLMSDGINASKKLQNDYSKPDRSKSIDGDPKIYCYDKKYAHNILVINIFKCIINYIIVLMLYYIVSKSVSIIFSLVSLIVIILNYLPYLFGYKYSYYRKDRWIYCICKDENVETTIYTDLRVLKETKESYYCAYVDSKNIIRKVIIPKYYPNIEEILIQR